MPSAAVGAALLRFSPTLSGLAIGGTLFAAAVTGVYLLRKKLLSAKTIAGAPTWDCGYNGSSPRIQYTASSFAQPITSFFRAFLAPKETLVVPPSPFPAGWKFHSQVPDLFLDNVYTPFFRFIGRVLSKLRWLQGGKVHSYVLYIALTLVALLLWNFVWKK
jgi:hypothetical protein